MASVLQIASPESVRRIRRVQAVTIAWMSVEAAVSLFAAWRAHSPALLAFGGDSAIELFSAVVVLWRFRASAAAHGDAERRAARLVGALLFALAAYVVVTSVTSLLGYSEPKPTFLGIAILVAAAVVMPLLAKEKRRLSGATGSAALRADAALQIRCKPSAQGQPLIRCAIKRFSAVRCSLFQPAGNQPRQSVAWPVQLTA